MNFAMCFQSIASVVEFLPEHDGQVRHANSNGNISIFEFDDTNGSYPTFYLGNAHSHFNEDFHGSWESPQSLIIDQWRVSEIFNELWNRSWDESIYDRETVVALNLTTTNADLITGQSISATDDQQFPSTGWEPGTSTLGELQQQDT